MNRRQRGRGGDHGLDQRFRKVEQAQRRQRERHGVGRREGGHDLDDVDELRHEAIDGLPLSVLAPKRHRQQQGDQEEDVVETQEHVLGPEVDERQEATQAAGRGQIELLSAGVWTEDQRNPVLVGERAGRPIVLDEQEAAVARLDVEQDGVVERQSVGHLVETFDVERHKRESISHLDGAVRFEVDRKRPSLRPRW